MKWNLLMAIFATTMIVIGDSLRESPDAEKSREILPGVIDEAKLKATGAEVTHFVRVGDSVRVVDPDSRFASQVGRVMVLHANRGGHHLVEIGGVAHEFAEKDLRAMSD